MSGARAKPPDDQAAIWAHFQNQRPDAFLAARPRQEFLVRQIGRYARGRRVTVLNVGIGDGHLERTANQRGWAVHALDPDPQSCRRLAAGGVAAHVGSVEHLPFATESLDFVVAAEVLEHLDDRQRRRAVEEICRVLRPGGWFLGTVPYAEDLSLGHTICPSCRHTFHRWGHQESFDLPAVTRQLEPWFEIARLRRTAFVSFRGRSIRAKIKAAARLLLAKCGEPIAVPTIYWQARKRKQHR